MNHTKGKKIYKAYLLTDKQVNQLNNWLEYLKGGIAKVWLAVIFLTLMVLLDILLRVK